MTLFIRRHFIIGFTSALAGSAVTHIAIYLVTGSWGGQP